MTTTLPNGLIAVNVPIESKDYKISGTGFLAYKDKDLASWGTTYDDRLPEGNWQILGTVTNDAIDFDVEPYVRKVTLGYWLDYEKPFRRHDYMCDTPNYSFRSMLSAAGVVIDENTKIIILKQI